MCWHYNNQSCNNFKSPGEKLHSCSWHPVWSWHICLKCKCCPQLQSYNYSSDSHRLHFIFSMRTAKIWTQDLWIELNCSTIELTYHSLSGPILCIFYYSIYCTFYIIICTFKCVINKLGNAFVNLSIDYDTFSLKNRREEKDVDGDVHVQNLKHEIVFFLILSIFLKSHLK